MPSPFPGMDPYLEGPSWADFHLLFIAAWRIALNNLLPPHYWARVDERVNLIVDDPPIRKQIKPDIAVTRPVRSAFPAQSDTDLAMATIEPVTIPLMTFEEVREMRIEIVGAANNVLVTVLEILSPWNKAHGAGQHEYLAKRLAILRQQVHLVEIDVLLAGQRIPLERPFPPGDYFTLIARSNRRPDCDVYAWSLRDRLPRIPIPLLAPDPDIFVDLEAIFATTYEMGAYSRQLDYSKPPAAPIPEIHRQWVAELAKTATPG